MDTDTYRPAAYPRRARRNEHGSARVVVRMDTDTYRPAAYPRRARRNEHSSARGVVRKKTNKVKTASPGPGPRTAHCEYVYTNLRTGRAAQPASGLTDSDRDRQRLGHSPAGQLPPQRKAGGNTPAKNLQRQQLLADFSPSSSSLLPQQQQQQQPLPPAAAASSSPAAGLPWRLSA